MNGSFIAPHTQLLLVRPKRDTVDLGLVRSPPQFPEPLPGNSVPNSDQSTSSGSRGDKASRRGYGKC